MINHDKGPRKTININSKFLVTVGFKFTYLIILIILFLYYVTISKNKNSNTIKNVITKAFILLFKKPLSGML